MFKDELEFFIANQARLVKEYGGKILVIKGQAILGVYDTAFQAYIETQRQHEPGTFMIQSCQPGPEAYSVTISPIQM